MNIIKWIKGLILEPEEGKERTSDTEMEWKSPDADRNVATDASILISNPHDYEDAKHLCDLLKEGKAVIIRMKELRTDHRQRFLDFLSGVIIAIEGSIRKLDQDTVICTPANIEMKEDQSE